MAVDVAVLEVGAEEAHQEAVVDFVMVALESLVVAVAEVAVVEVVQVDVALQEVEVAGAAWDHVEEAVALLVGDVAVVRKEVRGL